MQGINDTVINQSESSYPLLGPSCNSMMSSSISSEVALPNLKLRPPDPAFCPLYMLSREKILISIYSYSYSDDELMLLVLFLKLSDNFLGSTPPINFCLLSFWAPKSWMISAHNSTSILETSA